MVCSKKIRHEGTRRMVVRSDTGARAESAAFVLNAALWFYVVEQFIRKPDCGLDVKAEAFGEFHLVEFAHLGEQLFADRIIKPEQGDGLVL